MLSLRRLTGLSSSGYENEEKKDATSFQGSLAYPSPGARGNGEKRDHRERLRKLQTPGPAKLSICLSSIVGQHLLVQQCCNVQHLMMHDEQNVLFKECLAKFCFLSNKPTFCWARQCLSG